MNLFKIICFVTVRSLKSDILETKDNFHSVFVNLSDEHLLSAQVSLKDLF